MAESKKVKLPRKISGEVLERVCIKAAEEMGYRARSLDEFNKGYSLDPIQESSDYMETSIRIGNLFPALQVRCIKKGEYQDGFFIWTGFPHGVASDKKVQDYLSAVSKHL